MPEFKGTPGPWFVHGQLNILSGPGGASGDGVNADADDGWLIADCSNGFAHVDDEHTELGFDVQKANAQLIAAAPDLLAACQAAEWNSLDLPESVRSMLEVAIAKALGQ